MGWIIFGSVLLLIAVLLTLSVSFELNIENQADFKLRYAFFSIFPKKSKKNSKKKKNSSKSIVINKEKTENKNKGDSKENEYEKLSTAPPKTKAKKTKQKIDFIMIKSVIESLGQPLKKLVSKIRVNELYINSTVASGDAAKTAINYGIHCAAVNTALKWLGATVRLNVKKITVKADFDKGESDFFLHCKIKIRVITLIVCLVAFLKKYLRKKEGV